MITGDIWLQGVNAFCNTLQVVALAWIAAKVGEIPKRPPRD
jgi:hypothetical protein